MRLESDGSAYFHRESEAYGPLPSFDALESSIALRRALEKPLSGAAVIYEGGLIIQDERGLRVEPLDPNRPLYPIPVEVGPGGGWVIPD